MSSFGRGPIPGRSQPPPQKEESPPAQPRALSARLRLLSGPRRGVEIELLQELSSIGRSDPPEIVVDIDLSDYELAATPVVSRRHAELRWSEGVLSLRDLGSTNGTKVNGSPLAGEAARMPSEPRELVPGDRVVFANLEFEVIIDG